MSRCPPTINDQCLIRMTSTSSGVWSVPMVTISVDVFPMCCTTLTGHCTGHLRLVCFMGISRIILDHHHFYHCALSVSLDLSGLLFRFPVTRMWDLLWCRDGHYEGQTNAVFSHSSSSETTNVTLKQTSWEIKIFMKSISKCECQSQCHQWMFYKVHDSFVTARDSDGPVWHNLAQPGGPILVQLWVTYETHEACKYPCDGGWSPLSALVFTMELVILAIVTPWYHISYRH